VLWDDILGPRVLSDSARRAGEANDSVAKQGQSALAIEAIEEVAQRSGTWWAIEANGDK